uniref:Uncharacterized protein n=1 Tax=Arundo donax TaxID=35708 RepID=A0A0A9BDX6_ARUDO
MINLSITIFCLGATSVVTDAFFLCLFVL